MIILDTGQPPCQISWIDLGILLVEGIFFLTSRDTLRKYHQRTKQLLSEVQVQDRSTLRG